MVPGLAITVTTFTVEQPANVNEMFAVPGATPVTAGLVPLATTVAMLASLLLHTPPAAFVNVVVKPTHAVAYPPLAAGLAFT
jgi:hypothetical protein